jgi:hypothetical protein
VPLRMVGFLSLRTSTMTLSPLALRLWGRQRRQHIHQALGQDLGTTVEAGEVGFGRGVSLFTGTAIGGFLRKFSR